jgi:hypothetical protein
VTLNQGDRCVIRKRSRKEFESGRDGGLNWSMQHWLGVYWPEFQSPKFFAGLIEAQRSLETSVMGQD